MRIYKRHPFAEPNSIKMNELEAKCDAYEKTIIDLQNIRKHIADGTMTEALYDFINMDGSLSDLLQNLPRPSDDVACEALSNMQLEFIDAALESMQRGWKEILASIWSAVKEWFLDWIDLNRRARLDMQRLSAIYNVNPTFFGDPKEFETITARVFHKPDWEEMCGACSKLNAIMATLPSSNWGNWVESNKVTIQTCLRPFGHSVITPGPRVVEGNPVHDRNITTLGAARWRFNLLGQDMKKCITMMGDEIAARKLFGNLEAVMTSGSDSATLQEKMYIHFVRKLVMVSKANAFAVSRGLRIVLKAASKRKPVPVDNK